VKTKCVLFDKMWVCLRGWKGNDRRSDERDGMGGGGAQRGIVGEMKFSLRSTYVSKYFSELLTL
jgi:hypothetical protein